MPIISSFLGIVIASIGMITRRLISMPSIVITRLPLIFSPASWRVGSRNALFAMYWNGMKSIKRTFGRLGAVPKEGDPKRDRAAGVVSMFLHVSDARYLADYKVEVLFNDGITGIADLSSALEGPAFQQLQDITVFAQLRVDKELDTIVWPNGADFALEFLYFQAFNNVPDLQAQFRQWDIYRLTNGLKSDIPLTARAHRDRHTSPAGP